MVLGKKKDKHPQPSPPASPPPPPVPPPPPPPVPTWSIGSFGNSSIDHWDASFLAAVEAVKAKKGIDVDPRFMKAVMEVESGGDGNYPPNRCRSDDSCGPMQIKQNLHQWRCPECDLRTVPGQIELATHIIGDVMRAKGLDEYGSLLNTYFPTDDVINGTTQKQYADKVRSLVATMRTNAGGTTPAPSPPAPMPVDPIRVIVGGSYPPIDYGWLDDVGLHYYAYGVGHGTTRDTQHTGYDVGVPAGTRLFSPIAGVVDCVGGAGTPRWGQGCGAYADQITGGVGNITIFGDSGHKLTLGHCNQAFVRPGDRVTAGQKIGTSGGMNGPHCHMEVSVNRNGTYWLVDPGPALREAMGGVAPAVYAEPIDVPQPDATPPYVIARAIRTTRVRQRADPAAAEIFEPLQAGTEFYVQHQMIGSDKKWWFVGRLRGRVLASDCEIVKVVT